MNPIVIVIILCLFAIGLVYLIIRNVKINSLNKALKANDTERILVLSKDRAMKLFVSEYVLDLYAARAYLIRKDESALMDHLRMMMNKEYNEKDTEQYLTLYYHLFIHLKKQEQAEELLTGIQKSNNQKFIQYTEWTKAVLLDGRCDLCAQIEAVIENKDYYGFPLATCVYLLGLSKKRLGINEEAIEYLDMAMDLFLKDDVYVSDVKREIEELHQMGYESEPKPNKRR